MRNQTRHSPLTGMLLAVIFCMGAGNSTIAAQAEIEDFDLWLNVAGDFMTIDFTDLPDGTFVFEQYAELGVHFVDGADIVQCCDPIRSYPQDGAGLAGFEEIHLTFDQPQYAIGSHFPSIIIFEIYSDGQLIHETPELGSDGLSEFGAVVSSEPFDEAILRRYPGGLVFVDNIYFSSSGPDCDDNRVFDFIDVLEGTLPDCNGNLIPDQCDIDAWTSPDCNANGVPDECDISPGIGESSDCNDNGVPDECDVALETSDDCNDNTIPDECEVSHPIELLSPEIGPIGNPLQPSHSFGVLPLSATDVTLDFTASADLSAPDEFISVYLNGELIGHIFFLEFAIDCADPPSVAQIVLTADAFNALHAPGEETVFTLIATDAVNPFLCGGESYVTIALSFQSFAPNDLDLDGIPDECESSGIPGDLDADGDVDFNDLLILLNSWGECDARAPGSECPADLDRSGSVGFADLLILLDNWS